jgi:hypothetical protein
MSRARRKDIAASVRQRLLNISREQGEDFQLILTRFALERFLYRLSRSRHAGVFVLKGAMLECVFGGENKLNGRAVGYANWPTLENPWMKQARGGPLTVTDGRITRCYDFETWTVTETHS